MRVALLSDIHANLPALTAVIDAMQTESIDSVLVAGDSVGYYFWPEECLDLLETLDARSVRGNHEEFVVRGAAEPDFLNDLDRTYGPGHRLAVERLGAARIAALATLPHPLEIDLTDDRLLLAHGTPHDLGEYAYPDSDDSRIADLVPKGFRWVVLGHTHYPMRRETATGTVINPGSVGQQRNRVPGAHWAILDTGLDEVSFRVTPYDVDSVITECLERAPEINFLRTVLVRDA